MISLSFSMSELEYFLVIFTRITCFISVSPFYGMTNIPARVKIGLGFFLSVLMYYVTQPHSPLLYSTLLGYTAIIMKEAATGLLIAFGANICMSIVNFAGSIIDMEIGFSMVNAYDPTTRQSMSITAVYYQYMLLLLLIVTGMYNYIIMALAETFTLIPVNGAIFRGQRLLESMLMFMKDYLILGFRIALPVFVAAMLLNAILGILSKVSPQMNMFAVGMQLKVLLGLVVLFFTTGMLPEASAFIFNQVKRMTVAFVEGLM